MTQLTRNRMNPASLRVKSRSLLAAWLCNQGQFLGRVPGGGTTVLTRVDKTTLECTCRISPGLDTDSHLGHAPVHPPCPISRATHAHIDTHAYVRSHTVTCDDTWTHSHTHSGTHTLTRGPLAFSLPLVTSATSTHCQARLPPAHPSALVCLFLRKSPQGPKLPAWLREALTKPRTLPRAPSQCLSQVHPGSCWVPVPRGS